MKRFPAFFLLGLAALGGTQASAQYGLSGAPPMLPLNPPAQVGYQVPAADPYGQAGQYSPAVQPLPPPQYQYQPQAPQPAYGYQPNRYAMAPAPQGHAPAGPTLAQPPGTPSAQPQQPVQPVPPPPGPQPGVVPPQVPVQPAPSVLNGMAPEMPCQGGPGCYGQQGQYPQTPYNGQGANCGAGYYGGRPMAPGACTYGNGYGNGYGYGYAPGANYCGDAFSQGMCGYTPSGWYLSGSALFMGRDNADAVWTTYESSNNPNQLLSNKNYDWATGYDFKVGKSFCCGTWAVEAEYWYVGQMDGESSLCPLTPGGTLSTPLIVSDIEIAGLPGTWYFDGAIEHGVVRSTDFQNLELNLYRNRLIGDCCSPFDVSVLGGVRWLRIDDSFEFSSLAWGGSYNGDGTHDAYIRDDIRNNLIGVQVGADARYSLGCGWHLFAVPKMGIYNNHITNEFDIYRGDGIRACPTPESGVAGRYPVCSNVNGVSFLGQVDVGVDWQINCHLSAFLGYRVIGMTGIGLSGEQIPTYVVDIPEIACIDHTSSMVLHGGFAGVKVQW